jgi:hypothetical protein
MLTGAQKTCIFKEIRKRSNPLRKWLMDFSLSGSSSNDSSNDEAVVEEYRKIRKHCLK